MAVAFVTGMQGNDPRYLRVVSTPKHFAVHSGPEPLRHGFKVRNWSMSSSTVMAGDPCKAGLTGR